MIVLMSLLLYFLFVFDLPFFTDTLHSSIHLQEFISVLNSPNGTPLDKYHNKPFLHINHRLHIYPNFQTPIHHNRLILDHIHNLLIEGQHQNPKLIKNIYDLESSFLSLSQIRTGRMSNRF